MGPRTCKLVATGITKYFWMKGEPDPIPALVNVSLSIADGEFVCIVGPSGCGKTTFLNIVTGLLAPDTGRIEIAGRPIDGPGRDRATVFQQSRLLPWRTTLGERHLWHGAAAQVRRGREIQDRAAQFIKLVGLAGLRAPLPGRAVGRHAAARQSRACAGHRSRDPADGRAVRRARCPDARVHAGRAAAHLVTCSDKTVLFVTHQIDEAAFLSDRVHRVRDAPGPIEAGVRGAVSNGLERWR